jgi:hypothetical protein
LRDAALAFGQQIKDAPHHARIVDQGDDPHRIFTLEILQGIGAADPLDATNRAASARL